MLYRATSKSKHREQTHKHIATITLP